MTLAERFGANLVRCRKAADVSQEELALRASLHRTEISHLERGLRLPRVDTFVKLAGALEVAPAELLDGLTWKPGRSVSGRFVQAEMPGIGTLHRRFEVERTGIGGD